MTNRWLLCPGLHLLLWGRSQEREERQRSLMSNCINSRFDPMVPSGRGSGSRSSNPRSRPPASKQSKAKKDSDMKMKLQTKVGTKMKSPKWGMSGRVVCWPFCLQTVQRLLGYMRTSVILNKYCTITATVSVELKTVKVLLFILLLFLAFEVFMFILHFCPHTQKPLLTQRRQLCTVHRLPRLHA